ncbi:MAG: siderophore-interacting protein [Alloalcanivorax venustensis]|uniref:siderophore-interacting protein n=1 Tax=Alloalcanivorax venustensis TaxID=172371 RepID=UPI0030021FE7
MIPRPGQTEIPLPPFGDAPPEERPIVRTYTLRHFDSEHGEVVVDFMMHADHGPASGRTCHSRPAWK